MNRGEVAICEVPTGSSLEQVTPPAILFKVGDGVKTFAQLPWVSGLAADVYAWAKQPTKPTYTADEVGAAPTTHTHTTSQITDFTDVVNGLIDDKIAEIPSVEIPEYTLETGTDEGSVVLKKDGEVVGDDVIIQGYSALKASIAAKYTKPEDGIPLTDLASGVQTSLGKANSALQADALDGYATTSSVTSAIGTHNTSGTAHSDIRTLISTLSGRVDDLGNALHFIGVETELPESGENGDVVIVGSKEYVWANDTWNEFGSGDHITKAQADGYYDAKGTAQGLINALDVATVSLAAGQTIASIGQQNGSISVTTQSISITSGQVSGLGSLATKSSLSAADIPTLSISKVSGLQGALDDKEAAGTAQSLIDGLDKTDSAVSGQYVSAVSQTNGVISVTRAALPTMPTVNAGKLLDAEGNEIFNANQSTNDTIVLIDCGSATELVD